MIGVTAGASQAEAYGTAALPVNTWTFLAATYDGTTLRFFVNGTQVSSTPRTGNIITSSNPLQIGGDSGLRGYPLRYQSGERRVLFTLEARAYSDWYPFRLFRVGGAVFYDTGRAWKGENQNTVNAGWLKDVGFGLRLLSARTSKGNVLHADVAIPLDRDPSIESVQFLVKTKVAF